MPVISWLPAFVGSHAFVELCMASGLALFGCGMFLAVREQAQKRALAHRKNLREEWRRHRASKALALRVQNVLGTGLERLRAQQFQPTSTSMGRRTLNMLLSFAQFEREVTAERIRDKIAASKKKGMWMGGLVPLGYDAIDRKLVVNPKEAATIRWLFETYSKLGSVRKLKEAADDEGIVSKARKTSRTNLTGSVSMSRGHLYRILENPI